MDTLHWLSEYELISDISGNIKMAMVVSASSHFEYEYGILTDILNDFDDKKAEPIILDKKGEFEKNPDGNHPKMDFINFKLSKSDYSETEPNDPFDWENTTRSGILTTNSDLDSVDWEEQTRSIDTAKRSVSVVSLNESWEDQTRAVERALRYLSMQDMNTRWEEDFDKIQNQGKEIPFRAWVQDPFICFQKKIPSNNLLGQWVVRESTLMYSIGQAKMMDFFIALELSSNPKLNLRSHASRLLLEGGNMLSVDGKLLIGKDLFQKNLENERKSNPKWTEADMKELFLFCLQVNQVCVIGTESTSESFDLKLKDGVLTHISSYQPFFHIDLFINFGPKDDDGNRVVYLGSPLLALEMLEAADESAETGGKFTHPDHEKLLDGLSVKIKEKAIQIENDFINPIEKQLRKENFVVKRTPLYVYGEPYINKYICCTWNNALTEVSQKNGRSQIFLPSYVTTKKGKAHKSHNRRLNYLENQVYSTYKKDFDLVTKIPLGRLFRYTAQVSGSLRCMTKILRREG